MINKKISNTKNEIKLKTNKHKNKEIKDKKQKKNQFIKKPRSYIINKNLKAYYPQTLSLPQFRK